MLSLELLSLEKQQHQKLLYEKKANLRAQTGGESPFLEVLSILLKVLQAARRVSFILLSDWFLLVKTSQTKAVGDDG